MLHRFLIATVALLATGVELTAGLGSDERSFRPIETRFEAPLGQVNAILQDSHGFIWFGSDRGLHRFDGMNVKTYTHQSEDHESLADNAVWSLFLDDEGTMWVGTQNGLSRYLAEADRFRNYRLRERSEESFTANRVDFIDQSSSGELYVATAWGELFVYSKGEEKFLQKGGPFFPGIKAMCVAADNRIWISTTKALIQYNPNAGTTVEYREEIELKGVSRRNEITSLLELDDGRLLLGCSNAGVAIFDRESRTVERIPVVDSRARKVQSITRAKDGRVWVAHGNGITLLSESGAIETHYRPSRRPDSLPSGSVLTTYFDRQGNLWASTFKHGVFLSEAGKGFHRYFPFAEDREPSFEPVVSQVLWDSQDRIWLGYYQGGVDVFGRDGVIEFSLRHDSDDPKSIGKNCVYTMFEDETGRIWMASFREGIRRFNESTMSFEDVLPLSLQNGNLKWNDVRGVSPDKSGGLWIAYYGDGIARYDTLSNRVTRYRRNRKEPEGSLAGDWVRAVLYSDSGYVYVGSNRGFSVLDLSSGDFENFKHVEELESTLSHSAVLVLYESSDGKIWIGTKGGLDVYDPSLKTIQRVSNRGSRLNCQVRSIVGDGGSHIWAGTEDGLIQINEETLELRRYDSSDGLVHNEFFEKAISKGPTGDLYFGQVNGLTHFDPRGIRLNSEPPELLLTDAKLFYDPMKIVPERDEYGTISKRIDFVDTVSLSHRQSSVSFRFAAMNFLQANKNKYAYMLDGVDSDWHVLGNRGEANFAALEPGRYSLRVKASNNDGVWNENGITLSIVVVPPFWREEWFFALCAVLVFVSIFVYVRLHERRLRSRQLELEGEVNERTALIRDQKRTLQIQRDELEKNKEVLEERVEQRTQELVVAKNRAEESERLKSSFLANVSHEVRTPLNAIIGFTNLLLTRKRLDGETNEFLGMINESSRSLLRLLSDILDYSMIAANQVELEVSDFDLDRFVDVLYKTHRVLPRADEVQLKLDYPYRGMHYVIQSDVFRIRQILSNLVTNALKFTERGSVEISVDLTDAAVRFQVADTGIGIPSELCESVFGQFIRVSGSSRKRARGVGLGLAISKGLAERLDGSLELESSLGVGSRFTLSLPRSVLKVRRGEPEALDSDRLGDVDFSRIREGGTVLIVEDEELNFRYLEAVLKPIRCQLRRAHSGEEAFEIANGEGELDLVLMDINLPGCDGYEAMRQIRKSRPSVSIVAQTAHSTPAVLQRLIAEGFDDYLSKPVEVECLYQVLARYIGMD